MHYLSCGQGIAVASADCDDAASATSKEETTMSWNMPCSMHTTKVVFANAVLAASTISNYARNSDIDHGTEPPSSASPVVRAS